MEKDYSHYLIGVEPGKKKKVYTYKDKSRSIAALERAKKIIKMKDEGKTNRAIADLLNVSPERIRQIIQVYKDKVKEWNPDWNE